ncbi:MBL fold metallo-hydrolase, partial [bacterium]|nr:MBL fold metallo-hydrolase [bacterium]
MRHKDFFMLMDCGNGVLRRCLEAGLKPFDVDAILISHLHIDHIADIVPFLWGLKHAPDLEREKSLNFYGPPGFQQFFEKLPSVYGRWLENFPFPIFVKNVTQEEFSIGPWKVNAFSMQHGAAANGYRLQSGENV